jgi:hypothetical protein
MISDSDHDYLSRRAAQEREIASTCEDNAVARAHLGMADEYERRTREPQIQAAPPQVTSR